MTGIRWRIVGVFAVLLAVPLVAWGAWLIARGPHDEFATLSGHREGVFSLSLSPDGEVAASGGGDGTVRLWNLTNRRVQRVLRGHTGRVLAIAWSPDGELLATGGADKSLRLWNLETGEETYAWTDLPREVNELAFNSDGKRLAAAVDAEAYVWDLQARRDPPMIVKGHRRPITGITFLPGKLELATFASDKTVRLWDLVKKRPIAELPGPGGHCYGLALSSDGKVMACVGGARVHLYDVENRKVLDPIQPNAHLLCAAAFSPDGRTIAIGSQDHYIVVWDLLNRQERARLNGHNYAVAGMAFLPDGHTLLTSSFDSTLKLWRVN